MTNITAIILAAGRGTRMKSDLPKVLHPILGKPALAYVLEAVRGAGIADIVTVAGYGSELVKDAARGTRIVIQKELLGSGDAVMTAKKALARYAGDVLVICGDTPLIRASTVEALIEKHRDSAASLTVLTAVLRDPTGYGRIERNDDGAIVKIVEEEHARLYEEVINEVNVGTYCFKAKDLFGALGKVKPENAKKEYFLTDTVEILQKQGRRPESVTLDDASEMTGINTRKDLAAATATLKGRILDELMLDGVTVEDPGSTTIYPDVRIGKDTVIYPNTVIESGITIGARCHVGPFARLRSGVTLGDEVEVGNFVELVRTSVGRGTKVKHHTYLGDATVGKDVNIGAGTITANYDGKRKHPTVIGDGAFIGVGAILIAPVRIGKKAVIGAGAVVPKKHNVSAGATVVGIPARVLRKR